MTHKSVIAANIIAVSVVCFVTLSVWLYFTLSARAQIRIDPDTPYSVTYITDGDTFKVKVDDKSIIVRMLGINTPETVAPNRPVQCFGPEASKETKSLLTDRKVRLIFNPNREVKDKYGRYLAYVYRDDGLFINESLVKDGYAREYTFGTPYSFQAEFRADQKAAQSAKLGLWGACMKN